MSCVYSAVCFSSLFLPPWALPDLQPGSSHRRGRQNACPLCAPQLLQRALMNPFVRRICLLSKHYRLLYSAVLNNFIHSQHYSRSDMQLCSKHDLPVVHRPNNPFTGLDRDIQLRHISFCQRSMRQPKMLQQVNHAASAYLQKPSVPRILLSRCLAQEHE